MTQPASQEELLDELERLGIATRTERHPPVFTVEEARKWRGSISGGHTKNLFLTDRKGRLFLAVTLEDVQVDLKGLSIAAGVSGRFSFASAELLRQHLGVEPGSVTPFALINDRQAAVTALFDETMLEQAILNFHPLTNTATTSISSPDLLKFAQAQGHTPLCLRFPQK